MRDDRLIVVGMVALTLGWATMQRDTKTQNVSPIVAAVAAWKPCQPGVPKINCFDLPSDPAYVRPTPTLPPMPSTYIPQRTYNMTGATWAPMNSITTGIYMMQPMQSAKP